MWPFKKKEIPFASLDIEDKIRVTAKEMNIEDRGLYKVGIDAEGKIVKDGEVTAVKYGSCLHSICKTPLRLAWFRVVESTYTACWCWKCKYIWDFKCVDISWPKDKP